MATEMSATIEPSKAPAQVAILDPISRTSEILFGLIMVLSFTCSLSVAEAGRSDVRDMLISSLGCNVAWGVIDAFFYLMNVAAERGRARVLTNRLSTASDSSSIRALFSEAVPEVVLENLRSETLLELKQRVLENAGTTKNLILEFADFKGAAAIFLLVFLTTFPVAIPFLIINDPIPALRISNFIALLLLFALGYALGTYAGRHPVLWGGALAIIGSLLVVMTIALGG